MAGLRLIVAAASTISLNTWVGRAGRHSPVGIRHLRHLRIWIRSSMRCAKPKRKSADRHGSLGLGAVVVAVALVICRARWAGSGGGSCRGESSPALLGLFFLLPFVDVLKTIRPIAIGRVRLLGASARWPCWSAHRRQRLGRLPSEPRRRLPATRPARSCGRRLACFANSDTVYRLALGSRCFGALGVSRRVGRSSVPNDSSVVPKYFLPSGLLRWPSGRLPL